MMSLRLDLDRQMADLAQQGLRIINSNPINKKRDNARRAMELRIMAASIVNADKAMCHKGMVTRASDAL